LISMDVAAWREARTRGVGPAGVARSLYRKGVPFASVERIIRERYVLEALVEAGGHYGDAAKKIGVHRNTISLTVRSLGMTPAQVRQLAHDLKVAL
jgi:DNA-binding NtrC family response regulator